MRAESHKNGADNMSQEELQKFSALLDLYILHRDEQDALLHKQMAIILMFWLGLIVALLGIRVYLYGKIVFSALLLLIGVFLCFAAAIGIRPTEEAKKIITPIPSFIKEEEAYDMITLLLGFGAVLLPFSSLLLMVLFYGYL